MSPRIKAHQGAPCLLPHGYWSSLPWAFPGSVDPVVDLLAAFPHFELQHSSSGISCTDQWSMINDGYNHGGYNISSFSINCSSLTTMKNHHWLLTNHHQTLQTLQTHALPSPLVSWKLINSKWFSSEPLARISSSCGSRPHSWCTCACPT